MQEASIILVGLQEGARRCTKAHPIRGGWAAAREWSGSEVGAIREDDEGAALARMGSGLSPRSMAVRALAASVLRALEAGDVVGARAAARALVELVEALGGALSE